MTQFFLPDGAVKDKGFRLEGPEAFHLTKVLRYREGQAVELFDGRGGRYRGTITRLGKGGDVEGILTETLTSPHPGPDVRLTLFQGLLKASHWDWVLLKGTEVGVSTFAPVLTPRTVVLMREEERAHSKLERWRLVVLAGAKQSRRARLPEVRDPVSFREAIEAATASGLTLLGWEKMAGAPAREALKEALDGVRGQAPGPISLGLFIGPEGGFTDEEVELAESLGAVLFGLGPNTLRAETAALAAAVVIFYELGAL
jgi:16S rRNA (uracil1498-N3)-methyltransferase